MSQNAGETPSPSCGRSTPRSSVGSQNSGLALSIAGLPACSASTKIEPWELLTADSSGSLPNWSPVLMNGQVAVFSRFQPEVVTVPPAQLPPLLKATIVLPR